MAKPTQIKQMRYRMETLGLRLALMVIPRLSRKRVRSLAGLFGRVACYIDHRGRATAQSNLEQVFPEWSGKKRDLTVRESYRHQATTTLELFWATRNLDAETVKHYIRFEPVDEADYHKAISGAAICITLHYSNFEWMSVAWGLIQDAKLMTVAENFKNPDITTILKTLREFSGAKLIPQERAVIRLLKHLKRGGHTAFLTDLRVKPSKAATIIESFGMKTPVTIAHGFLAKQTGAPIIPSICLPQADGTYVFKAYRSFRAQPNDDVQQIAQRCWDCFEPTIRENPAPWLWMYKHWRYLPKDCNSADYPDYANQSKGFHRLEEP